MIAELNTLAKGEGSSWITLIVFAALAIFSVVVRLAERAARKKTEQKTAEEHRQREASGRPTARHPVHRDEHRRPLPQRHPAEPVPQAPQAEPVPQAPQAEPVPQAPQAEPAHPPAARMPAEYAPIPMPQPSPDQPTARPKTQPESPVPVDQPKSRTVEEEILRLQTRLNKLEQIRMGRLAARKPAEADTAAIEARIVSIRSGLGRVSHEKRAMTKTMLDLAGLDNAREAIVYHEIFSPPKALREQAELWDV